MFHILFQNSCFLTELADNLFTCSQGELLDHHVRLLQLLETLDGEEGNLMSTCVCRSTDLLLYVSLNALGIYLHLLLKTEQTTLQPFKESGSKKQKDQDKQKH